jgi:hypothetical protein
MEHLKGASLGQALILTTNIRLGWKGLPGINTLAYLTGASVAKKQVFEILKPGPNFIKLSTEIMY